MPNRKEDKMSKFEVVKCPGCEYQRYLTEAETNISYALVFSCLKCGSPMQPSHRASQHCPSEPNLERVTPA